MAAPVTDLEEDDVPNEDLQLLMPKPAPADELREDLPDNDPHTDDVDPDAQGGSHHRDAA